jgi:putative spermidine/putrescine transport system permease protein
MEGRAANLVVRLGAAFTLVFLYLPLAVVFIYAFNESVAQAWPPTGFTTRWFEVAWNSPDVKESLLNSVIIGLVAAAIAVVLGCLAAFAVHRFRFFGRETISFALVLPIALPGIITGMALRSAYNTTGVKLSLFTIMIGHATFCVVVVFNNVVARLRRTSGSIVEASMDLGADGWQTFRHVTLPTIATALVAGGLLAFALSFDEIIVTNFVSGAELTLPKWIYNTIRLPKNRPAANAVAFIVIILSMIPVYFAQRLAGAGDTAAAPTRAMAPGGAAPTGR